MKAIVVGAQMCVFSFVCSAGDQTQGLSGLGKRSTTDPRPQPPHKTSMEPQNHSLLSQMS
jgi:hypothetical protein